MQRLIDANKLPVRPINVGTVMFPEMRYVVYLKDIQNAPIIDTEPVVHGHWVKRYKSKYYHCSICGGLVEDEWHNCPHCRAKMDEEKVCQTEKK